MKLLITVSQVNRYLHWAKNLASMPYSIAVRHLASMISRNSAYYSVYEDAAVASVLLWT
jgi:hypothetical protein